MGLLTKSILFLEMFLQTFRGASARAKLRGHFALRASLLHRLAQKQQRSS